MLVIKANNLHPLYDGLNLLLIGLALAQSQFRCLVQSNPGVDIHGLLGVPAQAAEGADMGVVHDDVTGWGSYCPTRSSWKSRNKYMHLG